MNGAFKGVVPSLAALFKRIDEATLYHDVVPSLVTSKQFIITTTDI